MSDRISTILREKSVLFPLLYSVLFVGVVTGTTQALKLLIPHRAASRLLFFTLPFFVSALFTTLKIEKVLRKKRLRTLEALLLCGVWILLLRLLLPDTLVSISLKNQPTWLLAVFAVAAPLSWKTGASLTRLSSLPYLIVLQQQNLGKDFKNWAHNYLQSHSVESSLHRLRFRITLLFLIMLLSRAAVTGKTPNNEILPLLSGIASLAATLILYSLLHRSAAYCRWTVDNVQIKSGYFHVWRRFAVMSITIITSLLSLLPLDFELINRRRTREKFITAIRNLTRSGKKKAEKREQQLRNINQRTKKKLQQLQDREPLLKEILRIAVFSLPVLLLLAVVGFFVQRRYMCRPIPLYWKPLVTLWSYLEKFLMVLTSILRLFLMIPSRSRRRKGASSLRRQLEEMFPEAKRISDEKQKEIRRIIALFLQLLEESGKRGFSYRTGETPGEYQLRLSNSITEMAEPSRKLTQGFYRCRYSREPAGEAVLEQAGKDLKTCLSILAGYDRIS